MTDAADLVSKLKLIREVFGLDLKSDVTPEGGASASDLENSDEHEQAVTTCHLTSMLGDVLMCVTETRQGPARDELISKLTQTASVIRLAQRVIMSNVPDVPHIQVAP